MRRSRKREAEPDPYEVKRHWLTCVHCGHTGMVVISLDELRDAIIAGDVYCSKCGTVREMADVSYGS